MKRAEEPLTEERWRMLAALAVSLRDRLKEVEEEIKALPEKVEKGMPVLATIADALRLQALYAEREALREEAERHAERMAQAGVPTQMYVRYSPDDDRRAMVCVVPDAGKTTPGSLRVEEAARLPSAPSGGREA